jgi:hypothetical protein
MRGRNSGRLAAQANAKSLVLEFQLRKSVITQQRDQLAQLINVDRSFWRRFALFFACSHSSQAIYGLHRLIRIIRVLNRFTLGCFLRLLLFSTRGLSAFLCSFSSLYFARIVDQLDDCEFSAIAIAVAQFQNACITAGPIFITLAEIGKEPS